MLKKVIKSSQHPIVKKFIQLRKSKKFRAQEQQIVLSGKNLLQDLSKDFSFKILITTKSKTGFLKSFKIDLLVETTQELIKKITGQKNPEPYVALLDRPQLPLQKKNRLLVLDQISDPGNLGSLLRSAWAFSFDAVILTQQSVDPFNDKTLRAAKGAHFYLPIYSMEKKEIIRLAKKNHLQILIADTKGKKLPHQILSAFILILGNEAKGTSKWDTASTTISIPMDKKVDSLNVAASGAILMFYLTSFKL